MLKGWKRSGYVTTINWEQIENKVLHTQLNLPAAELQVSGAEGEAAATAATTAIITATTPPALISELAPAPAPAPATTPTTPITPTAVVAPTEAAASVHPVLINKTEAAVAICTENYIAPVAPIETTKIDQL